MQLYARAIILPDYFQISEDDDDVEDDQKAPMEGEDDDDDCPDLVVAKVY